VIKIFEELSINAGPALQTELFDGWILRFANGYTKRSNSINPLYDSVLSVEEKIKTCEEKYQLHNLPVVFKLTQDSNPKEIDSELKRRNYFKSDETSVRVLDLNGYQYQNKDELLTEEFLSDGWFSDLIKCSNLENTIYQKTAKMILKNILGEVIFARKRIDGKTIGCGYGAIEREYIGIFDIIVDKNERGKGFGREIMNCILSAANHRGVKKAYLSVVVGNVPAENLYKKLGFKEMYRYWYRKKMPRTSFDGQYKLESQSYLYLSEAVETVFRD
jgi:GNAT superfamily N-acetyltransferase